MFSFVEAGESGSQPETPGEGSREPGQKVTQILSLLTKAKDFTRPACNMPQPPPRTESKEHVPGGGSQEHTGGGGQGASPPSMHRNSQYSIFSWRNSLKAKLALHKVRIISTFFGKTNACSFPCSRLVLASTSVCFKDAEREGVGQGARGQAWKPTTGGSQTRGRWRAHTWLTHVPLREGSRSVLQAVTGSSCGPRLEASFLSPVLVSSMSQLPDHRRPHQGHSRLLPALADPESRESTRSGLCASCPELKTPVGITESRLL